MTTIDLARIASTDAKQKLIDAANRVVNARARGLGSQELIDAINNLERVLRLTHDYR